jgi:pyroglutamyl-peptidase
MGLQPVLITGFEPYGGRGSNPAAEIARALDGREIAGVAVVGRTLPVSHARLKSEIDALLRDLQPSIVISLGLAPGELAIRIERIGHDIADFEIPDNDGAVVAATLGGNGPTALPVTLPVKRIERAILDAGIPARLSTTAGTFLCNACLYGFLAAIAAGGRAIPCGFIHLPYMPAQVADILRRMRDDKSIERHQRADLASMELGLQRHAIEIATETTVRDLQ